MCWREGVRRWVGRTGRGGMNHVAAVGLIALVSTAATAHAQTPVERGRYLVDTIMTCHNCHTPMGPNGPQFNKALSGGLRFDEPPFDVTASNITPDAETGIGKWGDADVKKALRGEAHGSSPGRGHADGLLQDSDAGRSRQH